jgi:hypothetical protein
VDLTTVREGAQVSTLTGQALGIRYVGQRQVPTEEAIAQLVRDRDVLVVLDNLLAFVDLEGRVPPHPLRTIKRFADRALADLTPTPAASGARYPCPPAALAAAGGSDRKATCLWSSALPASPWPSSTRGAEFLVCGPATDSSALYSRISPGWHWSALQIASRVDSRIAFALPFFNTEILASVMPTLSASAVTLIFRFANMTSILMMIATLVPLHR